MAEGLGDVQSARAGDDGSHSTSPCGHFSCRKCSNFFLRDQVFSAALF